MLWTSNMLYFSVFVMNYFLSMVLWCILIQLWHSKLVCVSFCISWYVLEKIGVCICGWPWLICWRSIVDPKILGLRLGYCCCYWNMCMHTFFSTFMYCAWPARYRGRQFKIVNIRWIIRALPVICLFDYCNTCDLKGFLNLPSIGGS